MRPVRVVFLVDEAHSILRLRAEAFIKRLGPEFEARLLVKEDIPGAGAGRTLGVLRELLRQAPPPDILYAVDMGLSSLVVTMAQRLLRRTRTVVDTGDLYGELHRESGKFGPLGIALRQIVERLMLGQAAAVVVRGRRHKAYLKARGYSDTHWIPDCVESPMDRPVLDPDAKRRLGVEGAFTIGVMGSAIWNPKYGFCYGWELVEVMHLLRDLPVKGIFIGDGDGLPHVKARAADLGVLDRIVFTGRVPYEDLPRHLLAMDVCISTQSRDWIGEVRTTAKLPEYLACGRYILASPVGEAAFVLPEEMLVPYSGKKDPEFPARLAERIRALARDPARLTKALEVRARALGAFDYDVQAPGLRAVLQRASGRG